MHHRNRGREDRAVSDQVFPVIKSEPRKTEGFPGVWVEIKSVGGMSQRDWFAGQALAGLCANPSETFSQQSAKTIADWAYGQADAMLKARAAK